MLEAVRVEMGDVGSGGHRLGGRFGRRSHVQGPSGGRRIPSRGAGGRGFVISGAFSQGLEGGESEHEERQRRIRHPRPASQKRAQKPLHLGTRSHVLLHLHCAARGDVLVRLLPHEAKGRLRCRPSRHARLRIGAGRSGRLARSRTTFRLPHQEGRWQGRQCGQANRRRHAVHRWRGRRAFGLPSSPGLGRVASVAHGLLDWILPLRTPDVDRIVWSGVGGAVLRRS
mmetsp:Transcript_24829/g.44786  ORF Transcript_24829/g.44786 Transcript_24829/m.44786 type:complete len:227 (+) Transcript_24829:1137-1817(+)